MVHLAPFSHAWTLDLGEFIPTGWGPQSSDSVNRCTPYLTVAKKRWFMVYIYNELVHGGYFMVYIPTYNWGGPSCRYNELGPHPDGDWI